MGYWTYFRGLVVLPLAISVLLVAASFIMGPLLPHSIYWFMYWFGGSLTVVTVMCLFLYIPLLLGLWDWFRSSPASTVAKYIWLFPIPCLMAFGVVEFSTLLPIYAFQSLLITALVLYGYIGLGLAGYVLAKRKGWVTSVT